LEYISIPTKKISGQKLASASQARFVFWGLSHPSGSEDEGSYGPWSGVILNKEMMILIYAI
jgi:hypothetical protein